MHCFRAHSWVGLFMLVGCVGNQSFDNGEDGLGKGTPDASAKPEAPPKPTAEDASAAPHLDASTTEIGTPDAGMVTQSPSLPETSEPPLDSGTSSEPPPSLTSDAARPLDPPTTPPVASEAGVEVPVRPFDAGLPQDGARDAGSSTETLAGTWDVIYSSGGGGAKTLTATLNEALLRITGSSEFSAVVSNGSIALAHGAKRATATRVTPGALDLGVLPQFLQGDMHFTSIPSSGESCDSSVSDGQLSLACTDRVRSILEVSLANLQLTATRTSAGESIFGDLGGQWSLVTGAGSCSVSLLDHSVNLSCSGSRVDGTATFTVDGDSIGGETSGGIEFTAQRR